MFIAIVGTRCAGKTTVQDYLVRYKSFTPVKLVRTDLEQACIQFAAALLHHGLKALTKATGTGAACNWCWLRPFENSPYSIYERYQSG